MKTLKHTIWALLLISVTTLLFAFKYSKDTANKKVVTVNQYVGKCTACDSNDDLCLPFKIYIDPNASSYPTPIVEVYDNANQIYYTNCGGTYSYVGGVRSVSGFNITINGVVYQYSGTLAYP